MKLKKARKRYDDVTQLFDRLYEDALEGRISPINQDRLMQKYQAEQDQLLTLIGQLETALRRIHLRPQLQRLALCASHRGILTQSQRKRIKPVKRKRHSGLKPECL